jgi:hypothetical protein
LRFEAGIFGFEAGTFGFEAGTFGLEAGTFGFEAQNGLVLCIQAPFEFCTQLTLYLLPHVSMSRVADNTLCGRWWRWWRGAACALRGTTVHELVE